KEKKEIKEKIKEQEEQKVQREKALSSGTASPNNQYPIPNNQLYRTGDLARWLPDGNIECLGRIDHQVKIRGFRIELGEIENRLLTHPEIKEAVVLDRESKDGDKTLSAYYVAGNTRQPNSGPQSPANLKDFLSHYLPDYMIPSFFTGMEKIPITPSGKVDRKALAQLQIVNLQSQTYIAPRNEIEEKMAEIWTDILTIPREEIGIDSDFFQLGGHSLRATIMVSKIHKEFNVKLPLAEVFRKSSIRTLSDTIKEFTEENYSSLEPVEKKDYYTLSSAQKRMYFLQQMALNSIAYNMPLILPVTPGGVSPERLEDAFRRLIRRHESLRTSFELLGETPIQRVLDMVDFKLDYYDISSQSESETKSGIQLPATTRGAINGVDTVEKIVKGFMRPFDLSRAPLIRTGLIKQTDDNFLLLVDTHHIVSDGTSHILLREDFFSLYNNKELKPLRLQYKDFSGWQNKVIEKGGLKIQEDYWLETLHGEIPRLNLYTDKKRPEVFSFAGADYRFHLGQEETAGLKSLAANCGGTLYMNLLAVLNILFYKYSGQTDIAIGSGIAGRPHIDLQQIVGMFINTLAMRNNPQGDHSYRTFLSAVIDRSIQAFQNQDIQFEELVDKLDPPRDPSRNPLFDISMVVQNFRVPGESVSPEFIAPHEDIVENIVENPASPELDKTTSKFDITFFITETVDKIRIGIEYYTAIFNQATIQRLAAHFKNIVKTVINDPEIKLDEIVIISEKEKQQLLYDFNDTTREYPAEKTIHQLFEEQVERTPDSVSTVGSIQPSPVLHHTTYHLPPTT
ncbi:MAG: AMP-binding protein, partial [bacterium]|nr:AMP-binding protein [bacterium]